MVKFKKKTILKGFILFFINQLLRPQHLREREDVCKRAQNHLNTFKRFPAKYNPFGSSCYGYCPQSSGLNCTCFFCILYQQLSIIENFQEFFTAVLSHFHIFSFFHPLSLSIHNSLSSLKSLIIILDLIFIFSSSIFTGKYTSKERLSSQFQGEWGYGNE